MSLIIWQPAQYVAEFSTATGSHGHAVPDNGKKLSGVYGRDTVIREVTRFKGWKKECFRDAGEFEITTADVEPADVKRGNMVWLDGSVFVIEAFDWNLTENGYECTMNGRDFWRYPESEINPRFIGEPYRRRTGGDNYADETNRFNGEELVWEIGEFLFEEALNRAGWFRDPRRYPHGGSDGYLYPELMVAYPEGFTTKKTDAEPVVSEIMSYASEWRTFANWLGVGLRFRFEFDEGAGVFTIHPEIYEGEDNGAELYADGRGVSAFRYSEDGRNAVTAVLATWISEKRTFGGTNHKYKGNAFTGTTYADEAAAETVNYFNYLPEDGAQSYAERLALYSEKHLDAGTVPTESDATKAKMMSWLRSAVEAEIVKPEVSYEFEYDNSGPYKYGVHFGLGDKITMRADYLGVTAKQRLVTVKTKYDAGAPKSYEFEFGEQTIKSAYVAKIARKIAEIDKRTGSAQRKVASE